MAAQRLLHSDCSNTAERRLAEATSEQTTTPALAALAPAKHLLEEVGALFMHARRGACQRAGVTQAIAVGIPLQPLSARALLQPPPQLETLFRSESRERLLR